MTLWQIDAEHHFAEIHYQRHMAMLAVTQARVPSCMPTKESVNSFNKQVEKELNDYGAKRR